VGNCAVDRVSINLGSDSGREHIGIALPPKACHVLNVDLFAQYLLNGQISTLDQPPMRIEDRSPKIEQMSNSDISLENMKFCDLNFESTVLNDRDITCYTQLYSKSGSDENVMGSNSPMDMFYERGVDCGSQTNVSLAEGNC